MRVIESAELKNFRCHEELRQEFRQTTGLIIGANGSGKTSILEAIYLALRGKSFKGTDREMLREGAEFYRVAVTLTDGRKTVMRYDGTQKSFEVDGRQSRRLPAKERYPVVLFLPDDLHLVATSPTKRRAYFDELFKQISAEYGEILGKYNRAVKQRNGLLKREQLSEDELFPWNILCARYGVWLASQRRENIEKINAEMTEVYRKIAKNTDQCGIKYETTTTDESYFLKQLTQNFQKDRVLGYTTFGIHRDDYKFWFNRKKAEGSASRGEVRSVILALKFIEAEILEAETAKKPLVLLDDIFSELDEARQKHLVDNFRNYQVIVTSTSVPSDMLPCKVL